MSGKACTPSSDRPARVEAKVASAWATSVVAAAAVCAFVGCAGVRPSGAGLDTGGEHTTDPADQRTVCGWEKATKSRIPIDEAGKITLSPGAAVAEISPADDASYGAVQRALKPANASLIRLKIVVEDRWLIPATFPQKRLRPPLPPPGQAATRVVGHRKITRDTTRPAVRFADLRLAGEEVTVFVENDAQTGTPIPIVSLASHLQKIIPKPEVFALTATPKTPWKNVRAAVISAACFDRRAGEEPYEVILD